MAADVEVAVVGYGPVGAALAVLLGQLGRSVAVLERRASPYPLPRAVHFDDGVGRIFDACGIGDELRRATDPVDVYEWRNGRGLPLLRLGRAGAGPSGWPLSSMFHQPDLEAALDRRARSLRSVDVRRGREVVGLGQDAEGVTLRTAGGGALRAAFAVACDGAGSGVRGLLGVPVDDLGFSSDWLVADVVLHDSRVFDPPNLQVCDPARPTTVVSGGPGRRRWEFMRLPGEPAEDLADEARAWELLAGWDVHPGNARLDRHAVYTFRAAHAGAWRRGRVLLAGDAAHLMPPFAGQGMGAGIRDAANLAWKLDLVLRGEAPAGLLDTYQQERLPSARAAIEFSVELGKVICVLDPAEAAVRDAAMSATVGPEPAEAPPQPGVEAGLLRRGSALAGKAWFPGDGWQLVAVGEPAVGPGLRSWFASIGGKVTPPAALAGFDTSLFARHSVAYALRRPDFHLYGTATEREGADGLIGQLRADLGGSRGYHRRGEGERLPDAAWPALPYEPWKATCDTLHAHTQLLGKLAAALAPPEPQLQHAALRLTARGWETAPLPAPDGSGTVVVALDLRNHEAVVEHSDGRVEAVGLTPNRPVSHVTRAVLDAVGPVRLDLRPAEVPWTVPLDEDDEHHTYDPGQAATYFAAATRAAMVLATLRAPYRGRTSPVNAWWGTFDLAVSLFSGRPAEPPSRDFIFRNAANAEQIEVGWWPGDQRYPKAAFFAYAFPAPDDFAEADVAPGRWDSTLGEYLLDWDDVVAAPDPFGAAVDFGRAVIARGCEVCAWDATLASSAVGDLPAVE